MRRFLNWIEARIEAKSRERARQLCGNPCTSKNGLPGRGRGMAVCLHCGALLVQAPGPRDD